MAGRYNMVNPQAPLSSPRAAPEISSLYTAQLEVRREGATYITMDTPLPENFSMQLASQYDRPFAKPLSEIGGDAAGAGGGAQNAENILRATTGATTINKYLSGAVWSAGSTLTLSIPFVITAYDNAALEVTDKMKKLLQLVAPSEGVGGMLMAPGPHVGNASALLAGDFSGGGQLSGDEVTLSIGRFLVFTPCIITDVNCTFDTQFDKTGQPIAATINVTFEAYWTTTKEDLDKFFQIPNIPGGL